MKSRYMHVPDKNAAHGINDLTGETDLVRKTIAKYGPPDFFFCDTGEYCGLAEWDVVNDVMLSGSYYAVHDIWYPKSIKGFQVVREMEFSDRWEILIKTNRKSGLCIAQKTC